MIADGEGAAARYDEGMAYFPASFETFSMQEHSHAFLKSLLETPSASGYEQAIQEVVRSWARHYADEVRTDRHGNVLAIRYPEGSREAGGQRVMLAGHCDQI